MTTTISHVGAREIGSLEWPLGLDENGTLANDKQISPNESVGEKNSFRADTVLAASNENDLPKVCTIWLVKCSN